MPIVNVLKRLARPRIELSIVVGVYNMQRELPRTLHTLSRAYQHDAGNIAYELIIADNGSDQHLDPAIWTHLDCPVKYLRRPPGNKSPVRILNEALKMAEGRLIGLMIDGARMLSPGVFKYALLSTKLHPLPVICTHGFHLGPDVQSRSTRAGYNQQVEDHLLESVDWRSDGYRLFDISVFAGSSFRGWFVSPTESNCLIMPSGLWESLGYLDERFVTPGGGLVNLDIFKRACEAPGTQLITLLGEGSFHQFHGGAATGNTATKDAPPGNPNEAFDREYEQIRGQVYRIPSYRSLLLGSLHPSAARHVSASAASFAAQE